MWVFTRNGFVSIVKHRERKDIVIVRARARRHLAAFRHAAELVHGPLTPEAASEIEYTPQADYPFRFLCRKIVVAQALAETLHELEYGNFKDAAHGAYQPGSLMKVWTAMHAETVA